MHPFIVESEKSQILSILSQYEMKVSFENMLVLFSLQRLNILFDHSRYVHRLSVLFIIDKNNKNSNQLHHDFLPILMFLYIMPAYLLLCTALFNAACLHNTSLSLLHALSFALIIQVLFVSMLYHWVIET